MTVSEKIIWRVESREQIKEEHPDWSSAMIEAYLLMVEEKLKAMGRL